MPSAGQIIRALDFTASARDIQNTSGTTTSTTYTATLTSGTACGVTFVAPTSGSVMVASACQIASSGTDQGHVGFRVGTGSTVGAGTEFLAASDQRALRSVAAAVGGRTGVSYLVTGLTPGSTYNVQQQYRVSGSTGTFSNKILIVTPQPA